MTALSTGNRYWSSNQGDPIGPIARLSGTGYTNVYGTTVTAGVGVIASYKCFGNDLWRRSPSNLSGYQPLVPIMFGIRVNFEGANRSTIIGQMPDIRRVSMKYFTPAQVITVGADDWQVFPMVNSDTVNTTNGQEYSGYEGFAFKRIA
jgi:hypothetical protein